MSTFQFDFQKRHSAQAAPAFLIDNTTKALDKGNYFVGLFIDESKAFGTVDNGILPKQLDRYGFRGVVIDWLSDYPKNRQHTLKIIGLNMTLVK